MKQYYTNRSFETTEQTNRNRDLQSRNTITNVAAFIGSSDDLSSPSLVFRFPLKVIDEIT